MKGEEDDINRLIFVVVFETNYIPLSIKV